MQLIEQHIRQVLNQADKARESQQLQPHDKQFENAQDLVFLSTSLWRAIKETLSAPAPSGRREKRAIAGLLYAAEQSMESVVGFAKTQTDLGANLKRLDRLIAFHQEVRGMILMPTARQIASHDPEGRSPEEIRDMLLGKVHFSHGRPVITAELSKELPCPLDPEPVG